ncbi:MAG: hypothetical protein ACHQDD_11345 [Steroidobacterales bacterium]
MNVRLILIGMAAGLLLPLAAANAGAVFDPGLNQAGAGTDLGRGAAPTAENFWRTLDEDNDHKGDHDRKCDKSPSKNDDCDHGDNDHDKDHKCDKDDHNGKCDKDDHG